jgi:hypothetical protein
MSRGLSHLQKGILLLCLENGFLSTQEILSAWLSWTPAKWGSKVATVGKSEYNAGHASLSRTIGRLWRRGLVVIWKTPSHSSTGITLTDAGKALAQAISKEESGGSN